MDSTTPVVCLRNRRNNCATNAVLHMLQHAAPASFRASLCEDTPLTNLLTNRDDRAADDFHAAMFPGVKPGEYMCAKEVMQRLLDIGYIDGDSEIARAFSVSFVYIDEAWGDEGEVNESCGIELGTFDHMWDGELQPLVDTPHRMFMLSPNAVMCSVECNVNGRRMEMTPEWSPTSLFLQKVTTSCVDGTLVEDDTLMYIYKPAVVVFHVGNLNNGHYITVANGVEKNSPFTVYDCLKPQVKIIVKWEELDAFLSREYGVGLVPCLLWCKDAGRTKAMPPLPKLVNGVTEIELSDDMTGDDMDTDDSSSDDDSSSITSIIEDGVEDGCEKAEEEEYVGMNEDDLDAYIEEELKGEDNIVVMEDDDDPMSSDSENNNIRHERRHMKMVIDKTLCNLKSHAFLSRDYSNRKLTVLETLPTGCLFDMMDDKLYAEGVHMRINGWCRSGKTNLIVTVVLKHLQQGRIVMVVEGVNQGITYSELYADVANTCKLIGFPETHIFGKADFTCKKKTKSRFMLLQHLVSNNIPCIIITPWAAVHVRNLKSAIHKLPAGSAIVFNEAQHKMDGGGNQVNKHFMDIGIGKCTMCFVSAAMLDAPFVIQQLYGNDGNDVVIVEDIGCDPVQLERQGFINARDVSEYHPFTDEERDNKTFGMPLNASSPEGWKPFLCNAMNNFCTDRQMVPFFNNTLIEMGMNEVENRNTMGCLIPRANNICKYYPNLLVMVDSGKEMTLRRGGIVLRKYNGNTPFSIAERRAHIALQDESYSLSCPGGELMYILTNRAALGGQDVTRHNKEYPCTFSYEPGKDYITMEVSAEKGPCKMEVKRRVSMNGGKDCIWASVNGYQGLVCFKRKGNDVYLVCFPFDLSAKVLASDRISYKDGKWVLGTKPQLKKFCALDNMICFSGKVHVLPAPVTHQIIHGPSQNPIADNFIQMHGRGSHHLGIIYGGIKNFCIKVYAAQNIVEILKDHNRVRHIVNAQRNPYSAAGKFTHEDKNRLKRWRTGHSKVEKMMKMGLKKAQLREPRNEAINEELAYDLATVMGMQRHELQIPENSVDFALEVCSRGVCHIRHASADMWLPLRFMELDDEMYTMAMEAFSDKSKRTATQGQNHLFKRTHILHTKMYGKMAQDIGVDVAVFKDKYSLGVFTESQTNSNIKTRIFYVPHTTTDGKNGVVVQWPTLAGMNGTSRTYITTKFKMMMKEGVKEVEVEVVLFEEEESLPDKSQKVPKSAPKQPGTKPGRRKYEEDSEVYKRKLLEAFKRAGNGGFSRKNDEKLWYRNHWAGRRFTTELWHTDKLYQLRKGVYKHMDFYDPKKDDEVGVCSKYMKKLDEIFRQSGPAGMDVDTLKAKYKSIALRYPLNIKDAHLPGKWRDGTLYCIDNQSFKHMDFYDTKKDDGFGVWKIYMERLNDIFRSKGSNGMAVSDIQTECTDVWKRYSKVIATHIKEHCKFLYEQNGKYVHKDFLDMSSDDGKRKTKKRKLDA